MTHTIETKCYLSDKALETAERIASVEGMSLEEICAWYGEKGIIEWGIENPSNVEVHVDPIVEEVGVSNG